MDDKKYTYSQLTSSSVAQLASLYYDLPDTCECRFYVLGLHDNYLITSNLDKFILRIYRNDWRSAEEIHFELELLAFLRSKGAPVAAPVLTRQGEHCFYIDCPEGKRAAAMFSYADGQAPGDGISVEEGVLLGKTVAEIHKIADAFSTHHTRNPLDIPYLLDESIVAIAPFLETQARHNIKLLQKRLKVELPSLAHETGIYGICIGDVNPSNFHINDNKEITLFDFDQCGYGYRSFEIGKFISSIHTLKDKDKIASAFIDGYQDVRKLTEDEVSAIPYFEIISFIWVMAIHVYNANRIGYKMLERPFWDRRLAVLEALDHALHDKGP